MSDRPLWYLLDEQDNPYPGQRTDEDRAKAEALARNVERRRVALTKQDVAGHQVMISTVFTVWDDDYPWEETGYTPILYETALFIDGNRISSLTRHYPNKEEAGKGHEEVVSAFDATLIEEYLKEVFP